MKSRRTFYHLHNDTFVIFTVNFGSVRIMQMPHVVGAYALELINGRGFGERYGSDYVNAYLGFRERVSESVITARAHLPLPFPGLYLLIGPGFDPLHELV